MSILNIAPIAREGSHVIISITGPSRSGKTRAAINIARGLVGPGNKFGFLDTETGRGRLYAEYARPCDYAELTPPFSPERYMQAIDEFEGTGIGCLVIDSATHEWAGTGGIVEMGEASNRTDYGKWAKPKAKHKKFMNRVLASRMHIILCCRANQPLREEPAKDGSGKKEIIVGDWKEIQEKSFIYEMTVSILLRPDGSRKLDKCPEALVPAFATSEQWLTPATGKFIAEWVAGGAPVDHGFEELRRAGQEAAESGSATFTQWWQTEAVKPQRDRLRPFLANYQSIAKTADDEAARLRAESAAKTEDDNPFPTPEPAQEPPGEAPGPVVAIAPIETPPPASPATAPAKTMYRVDAGQGAPPASLPLRDEAFWRGEDLSIMPPARDGKLVWSQWEAQMRAASSDATSEEELTRLESDNSEHMAAFAAANPRARKNLRDHFTAQQQRLGSR